MNLEKSVEKTLSLIIIFSSILQKLNHKMCAKIFLKVTATVQHVQKITSSMLWNIKMHMKHTHTTRYTSVISAFLVESSDVAFDVAHNLFLVRKVRFPYQRSVAKDPHVSFLFTGRTKGREKSAEITYIRTTLTVKSVSNDFDMMLFTTKRRIM